MPVESLLEIMRSGVPVWVGTDLKVEMGTYRPVLGHGAEWSKDRQSVLITEEGLAIIKPGQIWVWPALVCEGDLTPRNSLAAEGNVVVTGNVLPSAQIRAGGSVAIRGSLDLAVVTAMGAVMIGGRCRSGRVRAGANRPLYDAYLFRLEALEGSLRRLVGIVAQLSLHPAFRMLDLEENLKPLLQLLVEQDLQKLPSQISESIRRGQLHEHLQGSVVHLQNELRQDYQDGRFMLRGLRQVHQTVTHIEEARRQVIQARDRPQSILIDQAAEDSKLEATGMIIVERGGCRQSHLETEGGVRVSGTIEGGRITAGEWIAAGAAGGGANLSVSEQGHIQLGQLDKGVQLRVGSVSAQARSGVSQALIRKIGAELQWGAHQEVVSGG